MIDEANRKGRRKSERAATESKLIEQYGCGPVQLTGTNDDNYPSNTVVYTGTHDNPTTRGWYKELPESQRENFWSYLKSPPHDTSKVAWDLMRLAWLSPAALAIAPMQDLLKLGAEGRMNVPGRADGNWSWRCTDELLAAADFDWLCDLTRSSNRLRTVPSSAIALAEAAV